jgi:hypothetical protein
LQVGSIPQYTISMSMEVYACNYTSHSFQSIKYHLDNIQNMSKPILYLPEVKIKYKKLVS